MKRFGPYDNGEGYLFFIEVADDGSRKSILVHREAMEIHIGRRLRSDEEVHHRNKIRSDNRIENLVLMTSLEHHGEHARLPEMAEFDCFGCGLRSIKPARQIRHNQLKNGSVGPFCSRSCAGRWNQRRRISSRPAIVSHGTDSGYGYHGCRCQACRAAHASAVKKYRTKTKPA